VPRVADGDLGLMVLLHHGDLRAGAAARPHGPLLDGALLAGGRRHVRAEPEHQRALFGVDTRQRDGGCGLAGLGGLDGLPLAAIHELRGDRLAGPAALQRAISVEHGAQDELRLLPVCGRARQHQQQYSELADEHI